MPDVAKDDISFFVSSDSHRVHFAGSVSDMLLNSENTAPHSLHLNSYIGIILSLNYLVLSKILNIPPDVN